MGFLPQRFSRPGTYPENTGENGISGDAGSISAAVDQEIDTDLQAVIDAWQDLPEAIKTGILAMVRTAGSSAAGGVR